MSIWSLHFPSLRIGMNARATDVSNTTGRRAGFRPHFSSVGVKFDDQRMFRLHLLFWGLHACVVSLFGFFSLGCVRVYRIPVTDSRVQRFRSLFFPPKSKDQNSKGELRSKSDRITSKPKG